jgi:hypothetical protein
MFGRTEIRELSSDEVPVAATATIKRGDLETELRFYEGRFYGQVQNATFEPGSCGLEAEMARAICDHLIAERASMAAIGPAGHRAGWRQSLWIMHKDASLSMEKTPLIRGVSPSLWAATKPFDPIKHSDELLYTWTDVATNYVSSLLTVDGRLWKPVNEPMLAIISNAALYDDASCYRARIARPTKLPWPFGTERRSLGDAGDYHPYWDPRYSYVTLLEAVENRDLPINGPCDVLMPEAFTLDHATLQLDRAARVAAASINWMTEGGVNVTMMKGNDWLFFQSSFKRLLRPGSSSTSDDIDHMLGEFSGHLARRADNPEVRHFLRKTRIQELIENARSRWNDRTVDLGADLGARDFGTRPGL